MNQISKLTVAFCFVFTFGLVVQSDAPLLEAQIAARACGCGNAKCGGCLKGRMTPVKNLAETIKPRGACGCADCKTAEVQSPHVVKDVLISTEYLPESASAAAPVQSVDPVPYSVPVPYADAAPYTVPTPAPFAAPIQSAKPCGCGVKGCLGKRSCKLFASRTKSCPQCDCDFCELKVSKTKDKKKCFEVTQKEVCIPAVRLPWKKNCPPKRSKVRVINVLKSKTYECPGCKYEWKVHEPDVPKSPSSDSKDSSKGSSSAGSSTRDSAPNLVEEVDPVDPSAPKMNVLEVPEIKKLDLETVPSPPTESR